MCAQSYQADRRKPNVDNAEKESYERVAETCVERNLKIVFASNTIESRALIARESQKIAKVHSHQSRAIDNRSFKFRSL